MQDQRIVANEGIEENMSEKSLSLSALKAAVGGNAAAIRAVNRLAPAGGPGDKVFPPTYMKEGKAETKYAFEQRRVGDREVRTVLLDSVASQANRMEEALLEAWRAGDVTFPVIQVDFSKEEGLEDLEQVTTLQAPHRIADAILRDSLLDGVPFRASGAGKAFTDARITHATAVYQYCPTALIFGVWDSTGPKGGMGAKFQRALVSEIVGMNAVGGVKTASRLDPLAIQKNAGSVFALEDDASDWTTDLKEAKKEKGKPVPFSRRGNEGTDKGTPAAINHGNVPPSINLDSGGVTIEHALQTIVLSLPGLRRLRFQEDCGGKRLKPDTRPQAEAAARTLLAALALAAVVFQRERGYDLRSRSILVPEGPLVFEILGGEGEAPVRFTLDREGAIKLVADAHKEADAKGLGWASKPVTLKPASKLAELVRKSRTLAATGEAEEDAAQAGSAR